MSVGFHLLNAPMTHAIRKRSKLRIIVIIIMDLNAALREEFEVLKSSAHSLPHAQLQAAWSRTMERALEALERKEEAFSKFEANKNELERKIETLSEDVGRWKEAFAEEENACASAEKKRASAEKKYQNIKDTVAYAIELYPEFSSQFCEANERLRQSQRKSYRGEGPSPLWKGIFDAKKPDLLQKLLQTDAREIDERSDELGKALGTNEIKFLYKTHPDSRNALKKLKVPIPQSFMYLQFPEECSAKEWAKNLYLEHEMKSPDYCSGSGRFYGGVDEWIQCDLGFM